MNTNVDRSDILEAARRSEVARKLAAAMHIMADPEASESDFERAFGCIQKAYEGVGKIMRARIEGDIRAMRAGHNV